MDAKNVANVSPELPVLRDLELPLSLAEALLQLASVQYQTNEILMKIVEQNQMLMAAMVEPNEDELRQDMEGNPIREQ